LRGKDAGSNVKLGGCSLHGNKKSKGEKERDEPVGNVLTDKGRGGGERKPELFSVKKKPREREQTR